MPLRPLHREQVWMLPLFKTFCNIKYYSLRLFVEQSLSVFYRQLYMIIWFRYVVIPIPIIPIYIFWHAAIILYTSLWTIPPCGLCNREKMFSLKQLDSDLHGAEYRLVYRLCVQTPDDHLVQTERSRLPGV